MVSFSELAEIARTFEAPLSLELWQNFMTGNYYYCFACQSACPVGRAARA